MDLFPFIPGYTSSIYDAGREPAFVMLLAFIITFICARGYTRLARIYGWGSASFDGVHTHHLVFGVILVLLAGGLMFGFTPEPGIFYLLLAAMFGAGAALVLDEYALIFHLQDVYWENEGRTSITAVILAVAFGSLFLLRVTPFGIEKETGWYLFGTVILNMLIVLVAALKGKLYMAIFGIFIPLLSLVAAIRLAEPRSIWAHRLYAPNSRKLRRSKERYSVYDTYLARQKDRVWDFIGGKPSIFQD